MTTPVEPVSIFERWADIVVEVDLSSVPEQPPAGPVLEDRPTPESPSDPVD
ncbi:hypothetical protein [Saccharothrix sp. HUAS TT1]|uniref:hypothetical protein n=1 Tax=unclassified Saccharothrix TaxID=2593673 RepID=UPI00345B903A